MKSFIKSIFIFSLFLISTVAFSQQQQWSIGFFQDEWGDNSVPYMKSPYVHSTISGTEELALYCLVLSNYGWFFQFASHNYFAIYGLDCYDDIKFRIQTNGQEFIFTPDNEWGTDGVFHFRNERDMDLISRIIGSGPFTVTVRGIDTHFGRRFNCSFNVPNQKEEFLKICDEYNRRFPNY